MASNTADLLDRSALSAQSQAVIRVEDLRHSLRTFGPKLAQIFGQGETPMTITDLPSI